MWRKNLSSRIEIDLTARKDIPLITKATNIGVKNVENATNKTITMVTQTLTIKLLMSMILVVLCIIGPWKRIKEPGASKKLKVKNIISVSESFVPSKEMRRLKKNMKKRGRKERSGSMKQTGRDE